MCGIAGVIANPSAPDKLGSVLARMGESLVHRGPDGRGQVLVPEMGAGLVSRRLSIVDLETGNQPIANEDGSIHVVVNGEIYNHRELRHELEDRGHRFRSTSDSEVVVHLYEEMGVDFLPRLAGMFALAILDVPRRRLLLARDRCGMKPLYYARNGATLLFGSEIKALFAGDYPAEPDFSGIDTYLSLGYVPAPVTCFKGVHKLPAGHCLIQDPRGLSTRPYWRFTFDNHEPSGSDGDYAEELQSLLDTAVSSHLRADVPVGLLISGGVDSSLVAAAARRATTGTLKTFSVIFPDAPEADERPYQQAMVNQIGSEHHEIAFRPDDIPALMEKVIYHQDVPCPVFPAIVNYRLAELVSSSVKSVLSGEGSDELFAGYGWHATPPYQQLRHIVPPFLAALPASYLTHVKWGRFFRVLAAPDEMASIAEVPRIFTPREKRSIMNPEFPSGGLDLSPLAIDLETEASCSNDLQKRIAMNFTRRMADGLLMVNDRIAMARSLEVRMPFLDNTIVDFARRLPPRMARRKNQEKYVLSLMTSQLPASIAARKKKPLSAPDNRYFRGPLREWARDVLLSSPQSGPLNKKIIEKRFDGWLDGSDYFIGRVRVLVSFQLWWNLHFGSSTASSS